MKKTLIIILSLAFLLIYNWNNLFFFYLNDYQINESKTHKELEGLLESWSDKYYFVKPDLYLRFNSSNQGYYQTNYITILTKPKTFFFNKDFLKVVLAHEFGHHYVKIKFRMFNLSLNQEETLADLVAIDLIGRDLIIKVLNEEVQERSMPEDIDEFKKRIEFISSISNEDQKKLLDPKGLDNN